MRRNGRNGNETKKLTIRADAAVLDPALGPEADGVGEWGVRLADEEGAVGPNPRQQVDGFGPGDVGVPPRPPVVGNPTRNVIAEDDFLLTGRLQSGGVGAWKGREISSESNN